MTHDLVSNQPPGPCSPPLSGSAEGHRERWRGSVRSAEPPPPNAREQGQRSAGSSPFNHMTGLPSRNWNIPAPDSRAHSHRSTRHRHSALARPSCRCYAWSVPRFAKPDKWQTFAFDKPRSAAPPGIPGLAWENKFFRTPRADHSPAVAGCRPRPPSPRRMTATCAAWQRRQAARRA